MPRPDALIVEEYEQTLVLLQNNSTPSVEGR